MRALLLAAGLGTRLRPLTNSIPKCMVDIHGRPLLALWLDLLFHGGIEQVLVNTHWFAEVVEDHVRTSPWADRISPVYEPELLGTGGTLVANAAWFAGQALLLAHADNLTDFDVPGLLAAHAGRPPGTMMTMLAFRTDDPRSCGILEVNSQHVVEAFHEKVENPPGDLANAAVYVFEPEVIAYAASLGKAFVDLSTEVIPHFTGRILAVEHTGYHRDIGNPEAYRLALEEFPPAHEQAVRFK
jgi:mannose-1-phosphate guanylyltransferase